MLRLALTPRWLAVAAGLVVLIVAAVLLGSWQWSRTQAILTAERAAAAEAIPVQEALGDGPELPAQSVGRPVTASGEYDATRQVLVTDRALDDRPGAWVVTGLRLPDASLVPVLRGWVAPGDEAAAQVPAGPVAIRGVLQPGEIFYADAPVTADSVVAISQGSLEQAWGEPVPPGFVVLVEQEPMTSPAPLPVPPTIQTGDVPFPLQNFFYAFQWWIFAAFGVFVYLRWLRIEARRLEPVD